MSTSAMQISVPIDSEILSADEMKEITGVAQKAQQIKWLKEKGWRYDTNASEKPVVGRLYARMKLAGIDLSDAASNTSIVMPDFSKVA